MSVTTAEETKPNDVLISEYNKALDGFINRLKLLRKRNRTLARLVLLRAVGFNLFPNEHFLPETYQAKRGKKEHEELPLKEIMAILHISHRQAQAYQQAMLLLNRTETLWNERIRYLLELSKEYRGCS